MSKRKKRRPPEVAYTHQVDPGCLRMIEPLSFERTYNAWHYREAKMGFSEDPKFPTWKYFVGTFVCMIAIAVPLMQLPGEWASLGLIGGLVSLVGGLVIGSRATAQSTRRYSAQEFTRMNQSPFPERFEWLLCKAVQSFNERIEVWNNWVHGLHLGVLVSHDTDALNVQMAMDKCWWVLHRAILIVHWNQKNKELAQHFTQVPDLAPIVMEIIEAESKLQAYLRDNHGRLNLPAVLRAEDTYFEEFGSQVLPQLRGILAPGSFSAVRIYSAGVLFFMYLFVRIRE